MELKGLFQHLTFRQERFRGEQFITGTFWLKEILALEYFNMAPWTFWHKDVGALEHFSTRIFQYIDVSAHVHFGTVQSNRDISAGVYVQNILVPKSPSTITDREDFIWH